MIDILIHKTVEVEIQKIKKLVNEVIKVALGEINKTNKKFYLSILLTNNSEIEKINFKYRRKKNPTNVLSFPQNVQRITSKKSSAMILGDIVISLEKIKKESIEQKKTFKNHLSHMLIHGLLHLFGYTHESFDDSQKMEKFEINILSKLSIPSPYN
tara:strand:+ start:67 stop:534 length:468 start_codon:yes stop_codon:yes gene_type:complete